MHGDVNFASLVGETISLALTLTNQAWDSHVYQQTINVVAYVAPSFTDKVLAPIVVYRGEPRFIQYLPDEGGSFGNAGITAEFTGDSSSCCLSNYASFTNPTETTLANGNAVEMSLNVVTGEFNWVGTDSFSDQTAFGTFTMTYTLTDTKGG